MNTVKKIILSLAVCYILGNMGIMFAQTEHDKGHIELQIKLKKIKSKEGKIMIAIYNTPESFLKKANKAMSIPANSISERPISINLPAGEYAISLFHDTNNNGILDTNLFGIPIEKYGFSNNAKGFMGPPNYQKSSFILTQNKTIEITLK